MAKRVPPLSAATLTKFKPDPVKVLELVDGAVPGLRVRITPAGTRSWSLNIRAQGKMRRFDVGRSLGLAEARLKAEDLRRKIKDGADPTAEKEPITSAPNSHRRALEPSMRLWKHILRRAKDQAYPQRTISCDVFDQCLLHISVARHWK